MTEMIDNTTWEIHLITPLHLGDGEELWRNMDYVPEKGHLSVYQPDSIFRAIADHPGAVSEMGRTGFDLSRFFRDYRIDPPVWYRLPCTGREPDSLKRFLKNAFGLPYLAGSTLKGGIRTSLWKRLDRSRLPDMKDFKAYKKAVGKVDGEGPHKDFLRPLRIGDSTPVLPENAMEASEIKWLNLNRDEKAEWRDFSTGRTLPGFREAKGIHVETMKTGTRLFVKAGISRFLLTDPVSKADSIKKSEDIEDFEKIAEAVNSQSLFMAEKERAFFGSVGPAGSPVAVFYDQLVKGIKSLEQGFILRIAWGSGWDFMTGGWMTQSQVRDLREKERLGKKGVRIFPKTRRLAMFNGVPCLPLGWIQVLPAKSGEFEKALLSLRKSMETKSEEEKPQAIKAPAPAPKALPEDPAEFRAEKLERFRNVVENSGNFVGAILTFLNRVKEQAADPVLQKEMCGILIRRAERLPKKSRFSKVVGSKKWARDLKDLCKECGLEL